MLHSLMFLLFLTIASAGSALAEANMLYVSNTLMVSNAVKRLRLPCMLLAKCGTKILLAQAIGHLYVGALKGEPAESIEGKGACGGCNPIC